MTPDIVKSKSAAAASAVEFVINVHRYQAIAIGKKIEKLKVDKRITKN